MCTNLVDSLECYMDDLVDTFEGFVKKSIIVLSVAISSIILMFIYALKIVTDRTGVATATVGTSNSEVQDDVSRRQSLTSLQSKSQDRAAFPLKKDSVEDNFVLPRKVDTPLKTTYSVAVNTEEIYSLKEQIFCDDEIPKYGSYIPRRPVLRNCSSTRLTVPNLPTDLSKYQKSASRSCPKHFISSPTSCCSMCCDDKKQ